MTTIHFFLLVPSRCLAMDLSWRESGAVRWGRPCLRESDMCVSVVPRLTTIKKRRTWNCLPLTVSVLTGTGDSRSLMGFSSSLELPHIREACTSPSLIPKSVSWAVRPRWGNWTFETYVLTRFLSKERRKKENWKKSLFKVLKFCSQIVLISNSKLLHYAERLNKTWIPGLSHSMTTLLCWTTRLWRLSQMKSPYTCWLGSPQLSSATSCIVLMMTFSPYICGRLGFVQV